MPRARVIPADGTILTSRYEPALDLGRIGIRPNPRLLCANVAREDDTIRWATEKCQRVPDFVCTEWGIA